MKLLCYLKQSLLFLLGIILFLYVLKSQPSESILILLHTRTSGFVLLTIVSLLIYCLAGFALVYFIRAYDPHFPFLRGIKIIFLSLLVENLTIPAMGKGTQMLLLHRQKLKWDQAISCIGFDFITFQLVTFIFSLLVFCDNHLKFQFRAEMPAVMLGFIADCAPLVGAGILLYAPGIINFIHFLEEKIATRFQPASLSSIRKALKTLTLKQYLLYQPKRITLVLFAHFLRILLRHCLPLLAIYALCIPMPFDSLIHVFIASIFIELMISIVPITGKHGIAESSFLLIYSTLLPTGSAVGVMVLWRLAVYYIPTLFAIIIFVFSPEISWHSLCKKG